MQRYNLREIAKRRPGTRVVLPPVDSTLATERAYLKALRSILREMAAETREHIVPLAVAEIQANRAMMRDAERGWFERLVAIAVDLTFRANAMVDRILRLESERHTDRFMASAKRALGVDLAAVVRQEDLGALLRNAGLKNAALIKGFSDDMVKRVQQTVLDGVLNGRSTVDLKKELTKGFQIADRRAQLIARTEVAKITAEMNKLRQQQAGVTTYEYMTAADERVRASHAEHDGKVFSWDKPPSTGHPGTEINCRCIARGVVTF